MQETTEYTACGIGWRARRPSSRWCDALLGANPTRSLVPGLVTLTLVRSRTGIVRSRSFRSEEYLLFTPRRAIYPSRRRTAGRHRRPFSSLNAHPDLYVSQKVTIQPVERI